MPVRVVRVLEYVYDDLDAATEDMARWTLKSESSWLRGRVTMRSLAFAPSPDEPADPPSKRGGMSIVSRGRGGGKTYALLKRMAAEADTVMVCHSEVGARSTLEQARRSFPETFWDDHRFVVFDSTSSKRGRYFSRSKVYIDNIDLILSQLCGVPYGDIVVSLTGEDLGP